MVVVALLTYGCAEMPKYVNNLDPVINNDALTLLTTDKGKYVRFVQPEYEVEAAAFAFGEISYKYGVRYGSHSTILKDDSVIVVDLKIVNKTDKKLEFKDYYVMLYEKYDKALYRWPEDQIKSIVSLSLTEGLPADTALAREVLSNLKENYFVLDADLLPNETRRGFVAFTKTGDTKIRYPVRLSVIVKYPNANLTFDKKTAEPAPSLF